MKKADVIEYPEAFDHVGLLVNRPPGTTGLPFALSSDFELDFPREPVELTRLSSAPYHTAPKGENKDNG